ncbi:Rho GTPase-activating protein 9, partial [Frankliniella fusca]
PGRLDAGLTQRLGQQLQLRLPGQQPPLPLTKSRSQHAALQQESASEDDDDDMAVQAGAVAGGLRRCLTQPMPDHDLDLDGLEDVSGNASIADRLKLLQKNGQTGWRKRVVRPAQPHEDVAKSVSSTMPWLELALFVAGLVVLLLHRRRKPLPVPAPVAAYAAVTSAEVPSPPLASSRSAPPSPPPPPPPPSDPLPAGNVQSGLVGEGASSDTPRDPVPVA